MESARFFVLCLMAFGFLVAFLLGISARFLKDPARRVKLRFLSSLLFGCCIVPACLINLVAIKRSPRVQVEGPVQHVSVSSGRGSHTTFQVTTKDGPTRKLAIDDVSGTLEENAAVQLTYVQTEGTVTELTITSGPHAGWTHHEGDGTQTLFVITLLGAAYIMFAFWQRRRMSVV